MNDKAIAYNEISDPQLEDALYLLDRMTIHSTDSVLDLGCGPGRLALVLADRGVSTVLGVDPDQDRIQVAISKGAPNGVQFMVGDDTNFPEGQYDVVLSTDVFHWIKDKERAFKRIYDNMKPGGRFGITTTPIALPDLLKEMLTIVDHLEDAIGNFHTVPMSHYVELANSVGFDITLMDERDRVSIFPNIQTYTECVDAVYGGKYNLLNDPALDEIKKRYEGQPIDATAKKLTIVLTKPLA